VRTSFVVYKVRRVGGVYSHFSDMPSFDELLEDTDDQLFNKINNNVEHRLHSLHRPPSVAPDHYELR